MKKNSLVKASDWHNPDNLPTAGDPLWRFLVEGEKPQFGDEWCRLIDNRFTEWRACSLNCKFYPENTYRTKRPLPLPAPQPGGGGEEPNVSVEKPATESAEPNANGLGSRSGASPDASLPPIALPVRAEAIGELHDKAFKAIFPHGTATHAEETIHAKGMEVIRCLSRELEDAKAEVAQGQKLLRHIYDNFPADGCKGAFDRVDLASKEINTLRAELAALRAAPRSETEGRDAALVDWIASHPLDAIELIRKNTWSLATAPKDSAYINTKDMKHTCGIREAFAALAHEQEDWE